VKPSQLKKTARKKKIKKINTEGQRRNMIEKKWYSMQAEEMK